MFTFNGVTASTMGINVNRATIQAITNQDNQFKELTADDGLLDFGTFLKEKYITFECNFKPKTSLSVMMATIDTLNGYLNPKLGLKSLILDSTPARQYFAKLANGLDITKVVRTGAVFNLVFVCPDPYAYTIASTNIQYTTGGTKNPSIGGNATVKPIITIVADIDPADDHLVLNFNNDEDIIEIKDTITSSYELEIDCNNCIVIYRNISTLAESNGLPYLERVAFPELLNGANTLEITVGSGMSLTSIDIDYNARYI